MSDWLWSSPVSFPAVQVAARQMVGVYLSVWVRKSLLPAIRGVQVTSVGTGIMGYLGNKGVQHPHPPPPYHLPRAKSLQASLVSPAGSTSSTSTSVQSRLISSVTSAWL